MNRIILMGRLIATPELKVGKDTKYTNFTVAVDRPVKKGKETDFFNCSAFNHNADFLCKFIKKGQRILVSGAVHIDSYTAKNGEKKNTINIVVDTVENADGKREKIEDEVVTDLPFPEE